MGRFAALLIPVACSCADGPIASPDVLAPRPFRFLSPELIGATATIHTAENTDSWRPGDEVIYGIAFRSPDENRDWLVRIRVVEPPPAERDGGGGVTLEVETFDAFGKREHFARIEVDAGGMEFGFAPVCGLGSDKRFKFEVTDGRLRIAHIFSEAEKDLLDRSFKTLASLFDLARGVALPTVVMRVVERPSFVAILRNGLIIRPRIVLGIVHAERTSIPGIRGDGYSLPFEVRIYGSQALRGEVSVTDARPPFLPGAGIVGVDAAHPSDPASTVSVRLLAATRGAAR